MVSEIDRFGKWLRRRSPHSTTHRHYTSDLTLFFAWAGTAPSAVGLRDVDAYVEHCQGLGHAVATVNRRLAALGAFYRFLALESDDAPPNPVLPHRHFVRQGRRLPRDVQDDDLARLFAVIAAPRDRAMFLLMLRCGLRVGEVRNLSLPDLYLQPVSGSLPRLWLRGKGGSDRVAYLSPEALAAVRAWLAARPAGDDPALFLNRFGARLTVTGIQDRLAHYCRQAGLWLTCHQLRHTFARHVIEAGMPVTSVQRLLGHVRLRSTETYLHISDRRVQADYEAAMAHLTAHLEPAGGAA
jgi:site-specific recombinase XerD